jgi:hypothetical protein
MLLWLFGLWYLWFSPLMFVLLNSQVTFYASYLGFNYVNTIGFLLMCLYIIQLLSGLQLSLYYNYSLSYYAFDSIQFIMKDVNIGNMIRIFHIIGSSFYMLFLWLHLLRGLFIKLFFYSFIRSFGSFSRYSHYSRVCLVPPNSSISSICSRSHYSFLIPHELATIRYIPKSFPSLLSYYLSLFSLSLYRLPARFTSNKQWSSPDKFEQSSISSLYRFAILRDLGCLLYPSANSLNFTAPLTVYSSTNSFAPTVLTEPNKDYIEVSFVNSFYFTFYYVYFIGIIIFFISIAVSFIGYTLVFGNLSYYGVIVVLGIISSVPSLLSYFIQFFFLFLSFLLILSIIVFLFIV